MKKEINLRKGLTSFPAIPRNEALASIDHLPGVLRCDVCGRHISELKPFGGPGDPLACDFTGRFLVAKERRGGPHSEMADKAGKEFVKEVDGYGERADELGWFATKFGWEKGKKLYCALVLQNRRILSWECKDCIVLDNKQYFKKRKSRLPSVGIPRLKIEVIRW